MDDYKFNIRVYGILLNDKGEVLVSTESRKDFKFTKFPGGGMDWGEGSRDCMRREIMEELGIEIDIKELFYLTEHFQTSVFREKDQMISIYYSIDSSEKTTIMNGMASKDPMEEDNHFYWKKIEELQEEHLTFPIDKEVLKILKEGSNI